MVIGIDHYHDASVKGRTVHAFVASLNRNLTKYCSRVCFSSQYNELMDGMTVCMGGEYHRKFQKGTYLLEAHMKCGVVTRF